MSHDVYGNSAICCWKVSSGIYWFQTRVPAIARQFARRKEARSVARSVSGAFLEIFQLPIRSDNAKRIVSRLMCDEASISE